MKNLFNFNYNKKEYVVELSDHSQERMDERGITKRQIAHNITSLTLEELEHLSKNSLEAMIIDKDNGINVVLRFKETKIVIITVIKKKNPYAKKNTHVVSI